MTGDADIAALGALLGDRTRCRVLLALGDGRALAASVLAAEAGVAASTASAHLGKLLDAGLVAVEQHGRHRYYRLAGAHVGRLMETLAELAPPAPINSLREGTRAHAVRRARMCYDHLGGRLGVELMGSLLDQGVIVGGDGRLHPDAARLDRLTAAGRDVDYELSPRGDGALHELGIDVAALRSGRRTLIRYCLDWSEQRHHLAGALGAALAHRLAELGWIRPSAGSRAVTVTARGADGLRATFGIVLDRAGPRADVSRRTPRRSPSLPT